jgi:hypothetical protein
MLSSLRFPSRIGSGGWRAWSTSGGARRPPGRQPRAARLPLRAVVSWIRGPASQLSGASRSNAGLVGVRRTRTPDPPVAAPVGERPADGVRHPDPSDRRRRDRPAGDARRGGAGRTLDARGGVEQPARQNQDGQPGDQRRGDRRPAGCPTHAAPGVRGNDGPDQPCPRRWWLQGAPPPRDPRPPESLASITSPGHRPPRPRALRAPPIHDFRNPAATAPSPTILRDHDRTLGILEGLWSSATTPGEWHNTHRVTSGLQRTLRRR